MQHYKVQAHIHSLNGKMDEITVLEKVGDTFITCETEKTRKGYATIRRRIPISPMFRKVWDMIDFEKAKTASTKTLSDTIKRVFPERHVHELRYTFISRCKECVQKGNQKIIIASTQPKSNGKSEQPYR